MPGVARSLANPKSRAIPNAPVGRTALADHQLPAVPNVHAVPSVTTFTNLLADPIVSAVRSALAPRQLPVVPNLLVVRKLPAVRSVPAARIAIAVTRK